MHRGDLPGDGVDQSAVGVAGDPLHPGQASGGEIPQKRQPAGAVLAGGDLHAEDLPVSAALTPVASRACTITVRPPSRTTHGRL